ncbi:MAG: hypothetical protein ABJN69_09600 [Hellea sp.]
MMGYSDKARSNNWRRVKAMFTLKTSKMTQVFDTFFVHIGFDYEQLKASNLRGWIYTGIVFMGGLSAAFLIMSVFR